MAGKTLSGSTLSRNHHDPTSCWPSRPAVGWLRCLGILQPFVLKQREATEPTLKATSTPRGVLVLAGAGMSSCSHPPWKTNLRPACQSHYVAGGLRPQTFCPVPRRSRGESAAQSRQSVYITSKTRAGVCLPEQPPRKLSAVFGDQPFEHCDEWDVEGTSHSQDEQLAAAKLC